MGNPNLRVEVADVGGGVLVALRRVLPEQVRAHARRYAGRHGWLAGPSVAAARRGGSLVDDGGGGEFWTGRQRRGGAEVLVEVLGSGQSPLLTGPVPHLESVSDFGLL